MASPPLRSHCQEIGRASMSGSSICAYVDDGTALTRIVTLLRTRGLYVCQDWGEFRSNGLSAAEAAVCVVPELRGPIWNDIVDLPKHRPDLVILLVTKHTHANGHALAAVAVDEVLFLDEASDEALTAMIAGLSRRTITRIAAALLRGIEHDFDLEIAQTLARACDAPHRIRSVESLARLMGYSWSQLERRWARCTQRGSHPKQFVGWLRLMHALALRARTRKRWKHVADMLGVKPSTLSDTCKRLFGVTPTRLEYLDRHQLLGVLWEILGRQSPRLPR